MQTLGSQTQSAPSTPESKSVPTQSTSPTFLIACWLLALIAFAQFISIALALTSERQVVPAPELVATPIPASYSEPIRTRSVDEILASFTKQKRHEFSVILIQAPTSNLIPAEVQAENLPRSLEANPSP